ncbi:transposase [Streptomyces sp. NPDC054783]
MSCLPRTAIRRPGHGRTLRGHLRRAGRTGHGTAARVHDLREIGSAIPCVNRTGTPWEYVSHDFPPCRSVYDYYAKWEIDGTARPVYDPLRDKTRRAHGRSAEPTAAVGDAQSVKTLANAAEAGQGTDAGKKAEGRKRHLIADGRVLAVLVTAASVHHTTGASCCWTTWPWRSPACPSRLGEVAPRSPGLAPQVIASRFPCRTGLRRLPAGGGGPGGDGAA